MAVTNLTNDERINNALNVSRSKWIERPIHFPQVTQFSHNVG